MTPAELTAMLAGEPIPGIATVPAENEYDRQEEAEDEE